MANVGPQHKKKNILLYDIHFNNMHGITYKRLLCVYSAVTSLYGHKVKVYREVETVVTRWLKTLDTE